MRDPSVNCELLRRIDQTLSWSVEYHGVAYDDARCVDNVWYYRHVITRRYVRFGRQDQIIPLYRNDCALPQRCAEAAMNPPVDQPATLD
jgi:hypothetical protein